MMKALITSRLAWIAVLAYGAHYYGHMVSDFLDGISAAITF